MRCAGGIGFVVDRGDGSDCFDRRPELGEAFLDVGRYFDRADWLFGNLSEAALQIGQLGEVGDRLRTEGSCSFDHPHCVAQQRGGIARRRPIRELSGECFELVQAPLGRIGGFHCQGSLDRRDLLARRSDLATPLFGLAQKHQEVPVGALNQIGRAHV